MARLAGMAGGVASAHSQVVFPVTRGRIDLGGQRGGTQTGAGDAQPKGAHLETFKFSGHSVERMAERNVRTQGLSYVLSYGHWESRAGAKFVTLRRKDIPFEDLKNDAITRLIGIVILVSRQDGSTIITVYRNRESLKHIRRKAKYERRKTLQSSVVADLPLAA